MEFNVSQKFLFSFFAVILSSSFYTFASTAHAVSSIALACPEKYVAKVKSVEDVGQSSQFPKVEVAFEISEVLKGDIETEEKRIQVIKDGPNRFVKGEIYRLDINNQWLCSATLVSHQ